MNLQLEKLHNWLSGHSSNYMSMIVNGSIAVDDNFIEGRSDYSVLLIFKDNFSQDMELLKPYLIEEKFGDEYLFAAFTEKDFLQSHNSTHDFSNRFRSKTIFGKDIIPHKSVPGRDETEEIVSVGIDQILYQLERRIFNSCFWSEAKIRNVFWSKFKEVFMYLAIKQYHDTGMYPKKRSDIALALNSEEVKQAVYVFDHINDIDVKEIVKAARSLYEYLKDSR